ncbi:MAG: hypothetical protein MHM6MM_002006 [Cercozoa sp. M6MM]
MQRRVAGFARRQFSQIVEKSSSSGSVDLAQSQAPKLAAAPKKVAKKDPLNFSQRLLVFLAGFGTASALGLYSAYEELQTAQRQMSKEFAGIKGDMELMAKRMDTLSERLNKLEFPEAANEEVTETE